VESGIFSPHLKPDEKQAGLLGYEEWRVTMMAEGDHTSLFHEAVQEFKGDLERIYSSSYSSS
jgi:hypothetical protein